MGYFISDNKFIKKLFFFLSEKKRSHSGDNQAQHVLQTLILYIIRSWLGGFVIDCCFTNNKLVDFIFFKFEKWKDIRNTSRNVFKANDETWNMTVYAFYFSTHLNAQRNVNETIEP